MKILLRKLHLYYYLSLTVLVYYFLYPIFYYTSRKPKRYRVLNFFRKINAAVPLLLSGMLWRIHAEHTLTKDGVYVYCPNHTSFLDSPLLLILCNGNHHFIGKEELLKVPVLKLFFKTIDITVKRESKLSSYRAFKRASENIENGMSLVIFPEGGILERYPPQLHHFKNGAFRLAIEKQVPVIPITLANVWELFFDDGKLYGSRPGVIDIFVHKPIETIGLTPDDDEMLKNQVYHVINGKIKDYEDRQKRSRKDSALSPVRR
ncbi:1-acyl-sn-glycerol-3-phosphate acyltransferase [Solitalea canadensis DSM 3403]|uniref:1-acyl-sn-glycerol-3-phosphate acyltransferase n=1 Tax=Solitalea canadensis (strain ATCC 29591 / DSM 3403 / JCM 21819 / LMG 8368 / NBRC 15130 / NCIMB 12057 / USAM 9D) TaxID=929556 RepID=H8KR08_SOLCM|nr:1-acyl-sn-glycerol-3-phosphate acyltransferase [Solitalea canadensis DSM 3403]